MRHASNTVQMGDNGTHRHEGTSLMSQRAGNPKLKSCTVINKQSLREFFFHLSLLILHSCYRKNSIPDNILKV